MDLESWLEHLRHMPEWLALAILFGSAIIEYVFPPFPGDTVTLAGGLLVTAFGWNLPLVFAAVTAGSLVGAMLDFYLGVWWLRRRGRIPGVGAASGVREQLDRVVASFRRHGEVYLVVNRFLPALRALFFVAAGLAGMRPARVALWATVSAILWNALIVAAGLAIGANLDAIQHAFRTYSMIAWSVIGAAVLLLVVRWLVRRRRARGTVGE